MSGEDSESGLLQVGVDLRDLKPPEEGAEFDLDRTRKNFTWAVLGGFGITVLFGLVSAFTGDSVSMLQVLERLLPAESAVVGATLGFYFISRPVSL
jgi:hypothetical protein